MIQKVNRRIGGLENLLNIQVMIIDVNRRIGGLENLYFGQWGVHSHNDK